MKKNDTESYLSVVAALLVILTAMINPITSLIISIALLISYATYKYRQIDIKAAIRPFVFSGIVACVAVLSYMALHDIVQGKQETYYYEYGLLIFSTVIVLLLFNRPASKPLRHHNKLSRHKKLKKKR